VNEATHEQTSLTKVEKAQFSVEQSSISQQSVTTTQRVSTQSTIQNATVQSVQSQANEITEPVPTGPSPYHGTDFCIPVGPDFSLVTGRFNND